MPAGKAITGVNGVVTIPTGALGHYTAVTTADAIAHITRWSAQHRVDVLPNDTFDNLDNYKRKRRGMEDMAGRIEGYCATGAIPGLAQLGTENADGIAGFKLQVETGEPSWSFAALISNLAIDTPKNGWATFTCDFESD